MRSSTTNAASTDRLADSAEISCEPVEPDGARSAAHQLICLPDFDTLELTRWPRAPPVPQSRCLASTGSRLELPLLPICSKSTFNPAPVDIQCLHWLLTGKNAHQQEKMMKATTLLAVGGCFLAITLLSPAHAGQTDTQPSVQDTQLASQLIAHIARNTSRKLIVDSRAQADALLIGANPEDLSFDDFLLCLQTYGFAAVQRKGYVQIVPEAIARLLPTPLVSGDEQHSDAEYVTKVIRGKSLNAAMLFPLLRPMVPTTGHMAVLPARNALIVVDSSANIRRIEALTNALDTGAPYQPRQSGLPTCNVMTH